MHQTPPPRQGPWQSQPSGRPAGPAWPPPQGAPAHPWQPSPHQPGPHQPGPHQPGSHQSSGPGVRPEAEKRARRRSHLPFMLALLVLLPLTAGFEYWVEQRQGPGNPQLTDPVVVASGAEKTYAGATWKLELAEPGPADEDVRLPDDLALVYFVLSVTPKDAKASKLIANCRFQGTDGNGRVWAAGTSLVQLERFDNPMTGCVSPEGDYGTAPIRPGKTQRVLTAVLVPKSELSTLRLRVLLNLEHRPLDLMT